MPGHKQTESADQDSAGTYFVTVEDFEWRPAPEGAAPEAGDDASEAGRHPKAGERAKAKERDAAGNRAAGS